MQDALEKGDGDETPQLLLAMGRYGRFGGAAAHVLTIQGEQHCVQSAMLLVTVNVRFEQTKSDERGIHRGT